MRDGNGNHKIRNTPSSPHYSRFTVLTKEGALEVRNLVSLSKPSHLSVLVLFQKKIRHYKINRRWQMTFIQNYYEKKIENEGKNILGNKNSPPKTVMKQKKTYAVHQPELNVI